MEAEDSFSYQQEHDFCSLVLDFLWISCVIRLCGFFWCRLLWFVLCKRYYRNADIVYILISRS
jgi:hypothetical protein